MFVVRKMAVVSYLHLPFYPTTTQYVQNLSSNRNISSDYPYDGIGSPWAGQVKATPNPVDLVKPENSTMEENFGLADPTGSEYNKEQIHKTNVLKIT